MNTDKKYSSKSAIMDVFQQYPYREIASKDFYELARSIGIFVPTAFHTHLSQLWKKGRLVRVKRSVYKYVPEEDVYTCIQPKEVSCEWKTSELKQSSLC